MTSPSIKTKPLTDEAIARKLHIVMEALGEWFRDGATHKELAERLGLGSGRRAVALAGLLHWVYRDQRTQYDPRDWRYWCNGRRLAKATKPWVARALRLIGGGKKKKPKLG